MRGTGTGAATGTAIETAIAVREARIAGTVTARETGILKTETGAASAMMATRLRMVWTRTSDPKGRKSMIRMALLHPWISPLPFQRIKGGETVRATDMATSLEEGATRPTNLRSTEVGEEGVHLNPISQGEALLLLSTLFYPSSWPSHFLFFKSGALPRPTRLLLRSLIIRMNRRKTTPKLALYLSLSWPLASLPVIWAIFSKRSLAKILLWILVLLQIGYPDDRKGAFEDISFSSYFINNPIHQDWLCGVPHN